MRFIETSLPGAWVIEPEQLRDGRGSFVRTFCMNEFRQHGLEHRFVQNSFSHSIRERTLRGMHFQEGADAEAKLVSCLKGAIFDVIVDLRPGSPTRMKWTSFELTEDNHLEIYVPKGFAHGFITRAPDTIVGYLMSEFHKPAAARGFRYDDPALGIRWPYQPSTISDRDLDWPFLQPALT